MTFDLYYTSEGVVPHSLAGRSFLLSQAGKYGFLDAPRDYREAVEQGLHISLETAEIRDNLASVEGE